jgi:hypothetical protein
MATKNKPAEAKSLQEIQQEQELKDLGFALRIAGINSDPGVLEVIIECYKLVLEKGNKVTMAEILEIQEKHIPVNDQPEPKSGRKGPDRK